MPDGLQGRTVLIARDSGRASGLLLKLDYLGAHVLVSPITATEPGDEAGLDAAISAVAGFDWVVVTSANAVKAFRAAADRASVRLADFKIRWAVVGKTTAFFLAALGGEGAPRVPLVPEEHTATGLVAAITAAAAPGARILLPQGNLAAPTLADGLQAAGFDVTTVTAYRTVPAAIDPAIAQAWAAGAIDAAVVAAPSAARQIAEQLGTQVPVVIVAIGNSTATAARECGFQQVLVADDSTDESLAAAVLKVLTDKVKP